MNTHHHSWKLVDTGRTYKTKRRPKGGETGENGFVTCMSPLHRRKCQCGAVEELRNGSWEPIKTNQT